MIEREATLVAGLDLNRESALIPLKLFPRLAGTITAGFSVHRFPTLSHNDWQEQQSGYRISPRDSERHIQEQPTQCDPRQIRAHRALDSIRLQRGAVGLRSEPSLLT